MTDDDPNSTADSEAESTDESEKGSANGGPAPEIKARLYEMEVTISGGDGDSLADVSDRFEQTWDRVLETYRAEREADDTRPFQ